jgi:hypothetical protein
LITVDEQTKPGVVMQPDGHDYYLVQDDLQRWTDAEVAAAESGLGRPLPPGYRAFVTTLGTGAISDIVRLPTGKQLVEQQRQFQDLIRAAWFFDDDLLTQVRALGSIQVADSLDGDMVVYEPTSGRYYVLPRHDDQVHSVGTDMAEVIEWFLESGVLIRPSRTRYFESFRGPMEAANGACSLDDFSRAAESIRSLQVHDVEDRDEESCTFFVKAIGGLLTSSVGDGPEVYLHFRYRIDLRPEVREAIRSAATAAGAKFYPPWLMAPAPGS